MLFPPPVSAFDRFTAHGGPVRDLALSPDGQDFVTASFDYSAVLWSANDIKEKTTLHGHEAALNTAKFSPDGRWLATGGDDGLIMLWRTSELKQDNAEPILGLASCLRTKDIELALQLAKKALIKDPKYVSYEYREEQLWGEKLQISTQILLQNEQLQTDVILAKSKINSSS